MSFPLTLPLAPDESTKFDNRTDIALTLVPDVNNLVVGDIDIKSGQMYLATGLAAVAQRLKIKFGLFLGEWFLNTSAGVPYLSRILIKNPSKANILAVCREIIGKDPAVASIITLDLQGPFADRTASIIFSCKTTEGQIFTSTDFGPFILKGLP